MGRELSKKRGNPGTLKKKVHEKQIVQRVLSGKNISQVAREVGVTNTTVYRVLKRENVKDYIEKHTMRMLEDMPEAVDNVSRLVKGMKDEDDVNKLKLCYQATRDVLTVGNVLPSQTQATFVQNIYNQQNNLIMSPVIREMIEKHNSLMNFTDAEVLEAHGAEEVREAQEGQDLA